MVIDKTLFLRNNYYLTRQCRNSYFDNQIDRFPALVYFGKSSLLQKEGRCSLEDKLHS